MNISEEAEEVLESLWISQIEKEKSHFKGDKIDEKTVFEELKDLNLIKQDKNGIRLTTKGKEVAEGVIRRHRLAERLFHDLIHMSKKKMESPACRFEHLLISGEVEEGVCTLLGHPRECPHGRRIPKGRCCRERRQKAGRVIHPLSEIKRGGKGKVIYIQAEDHNTLKKLMAMGILPGRKITLIQKSPSFVFSIGRTQIAVDKEIASSIFVRTE
ncbi:MAG: metal-dependent transcriptional regulator [Methanomassiliicoccales archaeon]|nr:MAG: metal-dependent transcriptional regulator [Methanomassiliicoccales archaeon]